jgi:branched-chain amino acid transport system permease protein
LRIASRGLPALVAALALAYPWLVPNYYLVYAGALTVMYAAMATSWNLLGGFTGYVSLGHSAFFGLGAYGTGLLVVRAGLPWGVALLVSSVAVTVFAVAVGVAAVRVRGASFVIVSIALVSMMNLIVQGWRSLTGGSTGLQVPSPFPDLHSCSSTRSWPCSPSRSSAGGTSPAPASARACGRSGRTRTRPSRSACRPGRTR